MGVVAMCRMEFHTSLLAMRMLTRVEFLLLAYTAARASFASRVFMGRGASDDDAAPDPAGTSPG
eukprot:10180575-Alexandrium_andersonii.AAC.1